MAKLERTLQGSFEEVLSRIDRAVMNGSLTATLEEVSDFRDGNSRCSVRVYERYSWMGSYRVSMSVTVFQGESGLIRVSAATSGGSQAVFFKLNTFGEDAFLDTLREVL